MIAVIEYIWGTYRAREEMSEDNNFCRCQLPRTTANVVAYNNVCPTCGLKLVDDKFLGNVLENIYQEVEDEPRCDEVGEESTWKKGLKYVLENLESPLEKGHRWSANYKLPTFSGEDSEDITHFFVKFRVYLIENGISRENEIIRIMTLSLSGKALELYLTLPRETLADLKNLERLFIIHFRPFKHNFLEIRDFLGQRKSDNESMAKYFLRLTKIAGERDISDEVVRAVIIRGLPLKCLKHVALQKANTLSEIKAACAEFEKLEELETSEQFLSPVWGDKIKRFREIMDKEFKKMGDSLERKGLFANGETQTGCATVAAIGMGENNANLGLDSGKIPEETDGSMICYFCGSIGHRRKECKSLNHLKMLQRSIKRRRFDRRMQTNKVRNSHRSYKQNRKIKTCFGCNKPGHTMKHCTEPKFLQRNKNEPFIRPSYTRSKETRVCFFCNRVGHIKVRCKEFKESQSLKEKDRSKETLQCSKMAKKGRRNYMKLKVF